MQHLIANKQPYNTILICIESFFFDVVTTPDDNGVTAKTVVVYWPRRLTDDTLALSVDAEPKFYGSVWVS